jgi:hypothetical protein
MIHVEMNCYSLCFKILVAIDFFLQLWPLVLFKKLCKYKFFCLLYVLMLSYFKLDLLFYMFAMIFLIRRMVKVAKKSQQRQVFWIRRMVKVAKKKVNNDKYFETEGVHTKLTRGTWSRALLRELRKCNDFKENLPWYHLLTIRT